MVFLLVDNSNSRTKLILSRDQEHCSELIRIDTAKLAPETLDAALENWRFEAVMICSVVPRKAEILKKYFAKLPTHFLSCDSDHGITIDVDYPDQVGADRIANTIGVASLYSSPAVVVDFGTAVTFDVIDRGGVYRGGVIAPGLGSMNDYLSKKTALLPKIEIEEPSSAIGRSTIDAMQSGAVHGYRGLVRGILRSIEQELGEKPLVISTGGDGKVIAGGMSEIDEFSSQITLEGLRVAAVRTFPNKG